MKITKFFMAGLFFGGLALSACNGGSALDRAKECDNLDVNVFFGNPTYDERNAGATSSFEDNNKSINEKLKVWAIIESISEFNESTQSYLDGVYTSKVVFSYVDNQYTYEGKRFNIDAKLTFETVPETMDDTPLYAPTGGQETTVETTLNRVGYFEGSILQQCHDVVNGLFDQTKDNEYYENDKYPQIDTSNLNNAAKSIYDSLTNPSETKEVKDRKYNEYFSNLQEDLADYCFAQFKSFLQSNALSSKYLMVALD